MIPFRSFGKLSWIARQSNNNNNIADYKMPFLVIWPLEGAYSVLLEKHVVSPLKPYEEYEVGDDLSAMYQGKKYPAKIVKKSENRQELQTTMMKIVSEAAFKRINSGRDDNLEEPVPKKKKTGRVEESNTVEDEAKSAKAIESRKKKESSQVREKVSETLGKEVLRECACPDLKAHLQIIEEKVDVLAATYEALLSCRSCLKKVFKKIDPESKTSIQTTPCPDKASISKPVTSDSKSDQAVCEDDDKMTVSSNCNTEETAGLAFLGEAKYGIKMEIDVLHRCRKSAKTAEKLALNLIEHLLSNEELKTSTIYGNKQHGKTPLDECKRRALRSEIASRFPEFEWDKVVGVSNDKIRKLRKKTG